MFGMFSKKWNVVHTINVLMENDQHSTTYAASIVLEETENKKHRRCRIFSGNDLGSKIWIENNYLWVLKPWAEGIFSLDDVISDLTKMEEARKKLSPLIVKK